MAQICRKILRNLRRKHLLQVPAVLSKNWSEAHAVQSVFVPPSQSAQSPWQSERNDKKLVQLDISEQNTEYR